MKKRRRKEFPSQTGANRFHYPVSERRTLMGMSGMVGIDPALQVTDNMVFNPLFNETDSLFNDTDPQGSYTGVPRDGGKPIQDADDL
ncbi:MAG: hypothetical protein PHW77_04370 [Eubacteriales bacterium]|nr:hypothetical protein [Eubacteriales bacterium]